MILHYNGKKEILNAYGRMVSRFYNFVSPLVGKGNPKFPRRFSCKFYSVSCSQGYRASVRRGDDDAGSSTSGSAASSDAGAAVKKYFLRENPRRVVLLGRQVINVGGSKCGGGGLLVKSVFPVDPGLLRT